MRGHVRISAALFAGLGLQLGAWVVLVPELVASRDLGPGGLGLVLGVLAASSILSLAAGGRVIDRAGRRPFAERSNTEPEPALSRRPATTPIVPSDPKRSA